MQHLEVSCDVRLIYTSLGAKGLIPYPAVALRTEFAVSLPCRRSYLLNTENDSLFDIGSVILGCLENRELETMKTN